MKFSFLKYRTNLLLKKKRHVSPAVPYREARTIGIIFTVEDKQKHFAVRDFIRRIETDGKMIQVLEYLPAKTENYEFRFDFFEEKDITFWGNLASPQALQFSEAPFDYLFYLDLSPNPSILNVLARSHAKCRVGRCWDNSRDYLDLMIEGVNTNQTLLDTVYRYTTQLR